LDKTALLSIVKKKAGIVECLARKELFGILGLWKSKPSPRK